MANHNSRLRQSKCKSVCCIFNIKAIRLLNKTNRVVDEVYPLTSGFEVDADKVFAFNMDFFDFGLAAEYFLVVAFQALRKLLLVETF